MDDQVIVMISIAFILLAPAFAYHVFRAAARGWFSVKHEYQRRLIDGCTKGDGLDGKSADQ